MDFLVLFLWVFGLLPVAGLLFLLRLAFAGWALDARLASFLARECISHGPDSL